MSAKLTRRKLAVAAAAPLLSAPSPAPAQQTAPEDDLAIQRENLRRNREALAKVKLAFSVEPAVTFRA